MPILSPSRLSGRAKREPDSFRDQLRKSGFYKEWKGKFGDESWALLEESAGKPL